MMAKNTFTTIGVLALLVFSVGFASAAVTFFPAQLTGTVQQGNSFSTVFKIQNDHTTTNLSSVSYSTQILRSGSNTMAGNTQSLSGLPTIITNKTNTSDVTYTIAVPANQPAGTYTGNLTISGKYTANTLFYSVPIAIVIPEPTKNFCAREVGDLKIDDLNIDNTGEGSDDEWEPLDRIEIEVDVENTDKDDDIRDVLVEIKIENSNGEDVTSDFDIKDEEIDLGTVRDDDTETATFIIEELPADLDEGDYKLYFKAYSERDEDKQCTSESRAFNQDTYHEIEFVREDDESVVVRQDDLKESIQAVCGENDVRVSFPVYNLGSDKEKRVLVNLYSNELGIDEYQTASNLRSGKRKEMTFLVDIPDTLSKDSYNLEIYTHFDYDDDEDELDENSYNQNSRDDLNKNFRKKLEILSCKAPVPSINAELASGAKIGDDMIVRVSIKNNGQEDARFSLSAQGFETWADLKAIEPRTLTVEAGESEDVQVTLVPKDGGFNSFRLTATSNGQDYNQPVSVNVAGEKTDDKDGDSALRGLFENKILTYVVIGIGILLILIFIILIGRVSRRSRAD